MISAKRAYDLTSKCLEDLANNFRSVVEGQIQQAIAEGHFSTTLDVHKFPDEAIETVMEECQKLGYWTSHISTTNTVTIEWDDPDDDMTNHPEKAED